MSSRKRPRDTPDFCDAAKAVSATGFACSRLPELKALFQLPASTFTSSLVSGGRKTSSRHLRRRTTSHNRGRSFHGSSKTKTGPDQPPSRRARRLSRARLQTTHEGYRKPAMGDANRSSNWIPTHIWHAKRFRMQELWGWKVPLIHSNRGCAATKRLLREQYTLMQDATWCMQPIWFRYNNTDTSSDALKELLVPIMPGFTIHNALSGQGVLYDVDSFPNGAIGPFSWLISTHSLVEEACLLKEKQVYLYLFVHPSMRKATLDVLERVIREKDFRADGPHDGIDGGLACFRLRGIHALECFREAVKALPSVCDFLPDGHNSSPHGFLFRRPETSNAGVCLLRRVCPRDPTIQGSWGVCGWDLFCTVDCAKDLFHALVLKGKACPIGSTEEASSFLECSPPLPLFPRDYPDTAEGESYWSHSSDMWKCIRTHWEGGDGRIRIWHKDPPAVDWQPLVNGKPLVVRGAFGNPFRDALSTAAHLPTYASTTKKRRKHRPANTAFVVKAPVLSKSEGESHLNKCQALLQSLSLPAVFLCYLQIIEKGKLKPASRILDNESNHIGYVVCGAFSHSQGRSHGTGIIGAAKFLEVVGKRDDIVVDRNAKSKELHLEVLVTNCSERYPAILSIPTM